MFQVWKDMLREQIGFGCVGIPRQDERTDTNISVGVQLGEYLIWVADDRCPGSAARTTDAGPEVRCVATKPTS